MTDKALFIKVAALLLALVGQLPGTPAHAAGRVALVIGNASYKEAPLRNPVNDARAMAKTLERLGFEVIRLENANRVEMERAIIEFTGRLGEDASGLFYYAGHGVQVTGRNYLIPVDAKLESEREVRVETINVNLVLDELEYAGNRLNIVILDACRNNPFERRFRGRSRGLAAVDAARGTLIAYSTAPGSVALDGDGSNGLYTEELLRTLNRPGLGVEEVFKQVRINVSKRTNSKQIPWESSSLTGEFVFHASAAPAKKAAVVEKRPADQTGELLFWETIKTSDNPDVYRAYLKQYPDGLFSSLARIKLEELESMEAAVRAPAAAPAPPAEETAVASSAAAAGGAAATASTGESSGVAGWFQQQIAALTPQPGPTEPDEPAAIEPSAIEEPQAKTNAPRSSQEYRFAIFPPAGLVFAYCEEYDPEVSLGLIRDELTRSGIDVIGFSVVDSPYLSVKPEEIWRPKGIRKRPDSKRVYEHARRLGVDGAVVVWYEVTGSYCDKTELDTYLYDARLQKVYRKKERERNTGRLTKSLLTQFYRERSTAKAAQ